ncbi:MAG: class I SAM-dependent methyltransferase [Burkholderiales bacterium]
MSADVPSTAGYAEEAAVLAQRYESITFEHVHRQVIALYPQAPSDLLDIGAGTGRDAAALARLGHRVVAVEPTAELREAGQRLHAGLPIDWLDDHLPQLPLLRQRAQRFDLLLLTAVWMHLDAAEREAGMAVLDALLADTGQIVMSLRHGPVPEGRRMFDVSAAETIALAARFDLTCHHRHERGDTLDRNDVSWSVVALRRS